MFGKMKLYCYAKADQMVEHRFTDDVAIVMAKGKKEAIRKFRGYYTAVEKEDVFLIDPSDGDVWILTDY